jgi:hypothetical protein
MLRLAGAGRILWWCVFFVSAVSASRPMASMPPINDRVMSRRSGRSFSSGVRCKEFVAGLALLETGNRSPTAPGARRWAPIALRAMRVPYSPARPPKEAQQKPLRPRTVQMP